MQENLNGKAKCLKTLGADFIEGKSYPVIYSTPDYLILTAQNGMSHTVTKGKWMDNFKL